LEGKSEEKAGMSVGLRERERERGSRFVMKEREKGEPKKKRKRASEAEEKEPRLVRIKFQLSTFNLQQPFPFFRLLLKERHP
jgi:hypothetical protein